MKTTSKSKSLLKKLQIQDQHYKDKKDLKKAGKRPTPGGGSLPIRPGPIDPKTGKPKYYYEDWRGYKGKYAKNPKPRNRKTT